jgi:hypothetical protein
VAFFGCLYFAALRPEEAVCLSKSNLSLPRADWDDSGQLWKFSDGEDGWGELQFESAAPHAGKDWTDSGNNRDARQLKQRARGESRIVPCCPELTILLLDHMRLFGTVPDGRLFAGERNAAELPKLTIIRAWQRARTTVFTEEVAATMLAKTPYDLRHAAVSTWLNGGVPATTVAVWAGHSLEVLLKIYAKCLDGTDTAIRRRVKVPWAQAGLAGHKATHSRMRGPCPHSHKSPQLCFPHAQAINAISGDRAPNAATVGGPGSYGHRVEAPRRREARR